MPVTPKIHRMTPALTPMMRHTSVWALMYSTSVRSVRRRNWAADGPPRRRAPRRIWGASSSMYTAATMMMMSTTSAPSALREYETALPLRSLAHPRIACSAALARSATSMSMLLRSKKPCTFCTWRCAWSV